MKVFIFLSLLFCLGLGAPCMDLASGRNNGCTSNDVGIANIDSREAISCVEGSFVSIDLRSRLVATASERYDPGIYLNPSGGSAKTGGDACSVFTLSGTLLPLNDKTTPIGTGGAGPYRNLDSNICGDIIQDESTFYNFTLTNVLCRAGANNRLLLDSCLSWKANASPCTGPQDAIPSSPSKCECKLIEVGNTRVISRPGVRVDLSVTSTCFTRVNDTLSYTYLVNNTGNDVLFEVRILDTNFPQAAGVFRCNPGSVDPYAQNLTLVAGATSTCTATRVVNAADITARLISSSAVVVAKFFNTSSERVESLSSPTVTSQSNLAAVRVVKSGAFQNDGRILYTINITNSGLENIDISTISDPLIPSFTCDRSLTNLESDFFIVCNAPYVPSAANLMACNVQNTVTVTGRTSTNVCSVSASSSTATRIPSGVTCRPKSGSCDLPEVCGAVGVCPPNVGIILNLTGVVGRSASCNGASSGSFVAVASGSVSGTNYNLTWTGPSSGFRVQSSPNFSVSGLAAGTYTLRLSNEGCNFDGGSVTIMQPPSLSIVSIVPSGASCADKNDGSAIVTVSGGLANRSYTLSWTGASASSITQSGTVFTVSGLRGGSYSFVLTNSDGCPSDRKNATVSAPAALAIGSITSTPVLCSGGNTGSITVPVSGGLAGTDYTLTWRRGGTESSLTQKVSPFSITGLVAGNYNFVLTNSEGCASATASTTLSNPDRVRIISVATTDQTCAVNGTISVTFSGAGTSFRLRVGERTIMNYISGQVVAVLGGSYTVTVLNENDCSDSQAVTIGSPTELTLSPVGVTNALCNSANGNLEVSFVSTASRNTLTVTNTIGGGVVTTVNNAVSGQVYNFALPAGEYTVTLSTNSGLSGCQTATRNAQITQPAALAFTSTVPRSPSCAGRSDGGIVLNVSGGPSGIRYLLSWTGPSSGNTSSLTPSFTLENLSAGTYTFVLGDIIGCPVATTSVTVEDPVRMVILGTTSTPETCTTLGTARIQYNASGEGSTWTLVIAQQTINNYASNQQVSLAGSASPIAFTLTSNNGCSNSGTVSVGLATAVSLRLDSVLDGDCVDGVQANGVVSATAFSTASSNTIVVRNSGGSEVARRANAVSGVSYSFSLPAGSYVMSLITNSVVNGCSSASSSFTLDVVRCVLPDCQPIFLGECNKALSPACCDPNLSCKRHITGTCNDTLTEKFLCVFAPQ